MLGTAADVDELVDELVVLLVDVALDEVVLDEVVVELELFELSSIPATTATSRIITTTPIVTFLEIACLLRFISKLNQSVRVTLWFKLL